MSEDYKKQDYERNLKAIRDEKRVPLEVREALGIIVERGNQAWSDEHAGEISPYANLVKYQLDSEILQRETQPKGAARSFVAGPIADIVTNAVSEVISADVNKKVSDGDPQLIEALVKIAGKDKLQQIKDATLEIQKGYEAFANNPENASKLRLQGEEHLKKIIGPAIDVRIDEVVAPPVNTKSSAPEKGPGLVDQRKL